MPANPAPVQTTANFPAHPLYSLRLPDWTKMLDLYEGERTVKEKGLAYLPATDSMIIEGMEVDNLGWKRYQAYKMRAVFHDVLREAVQAMIGVMHRKPPTIKLPKKLEGMLERATPNGESLEMLLRNINEQQLVLGRLGLLLDVGTGLGPDALPYIAMFTGKSLVNWDVGTNEQAEKKIEMVFLDESEYERSTTLGWSWRTKARCCISDVSQINEPNPNVEAGKGFLVAIIKDAADIQGANFITPSIAGQSLDRIPFVFINANDLDAKTEAPPLLGLANIALTLYRNEADYQQNLHQQAQDTLVLIGAENRDTAVRTGAGSVIDLKKGGDAKYVGVNSQGLAEQRLAIQDAKHAASERGARLLEVDATGSAASGEALRIRVAARTTTLTQVAKTGGEGLERILRHAAEWVGADPEEVEVEPFTEFADIAFGGQELLYLVQAKKLGAPISYETIHTIMAAHDMTSMSYEDEQALCDDEAAASPGAFAGAGGIPGAFGAPGQAPGQVPGQVPGQKQVAPPPPSDKPGTSGAPGGRDAQAKQVPAGDGGASGE